MSKPYEIRPHHVTGIRGVDIPGIGANAAARHWCLAVDPEAGTVRWQWRAEKSLLMRLPGRGPEDLPELARLVLADSFDGDDAQAGGRRWLVLVGADGRALCQAATAVTPIFQKLFDDDAFRPLAPYGVEVVRERFGHSRELERRYPGSESWVRKLVVDHVALTTIGGVALMSALIVVILVLFD